MRLKTKGLWPSVKERPVGTGTRRGWPDAHHQAAIWPRREIALV
jgi:hypothetical protein